MSTLSPGLQFDLHQFIQEDAKTVAEVIEFGEKLHRIEREMQEDAMAQPSPWYGEEYDFAVEGATYLGQQFGTMSELWRYPDGSYLKVDFRAMAGRCGTLDWDEVRKCWVLR